MTQSAADALGSLGDPERTVLFIGLGRIGMILARRLLAAGVAVRAWDRDDAAVERWRKAGGIVADAAEIDTPRPHAVMLCLPTPQGVDELLDTWSRTGRQLSAPLVIDLGTTPPSVSRGFAQRVRALGSDYLDAPITGGTAGAQSGEMAVMVGGTAQAYARASGLLAALAGTVRHLGPAGAGSQLKAIVQFIYLSYNVAFGLGAKLALQAGLPQAALLDVLCNGASAHPLINDRLDALAAAAPDEPSSAFRTWRALKDLSGLEGRSAYQPHAARWLDLLEGTLRDGASMSSGEVDLLTAVAPEVWPPSAERP